MKTTLFTFISFLLLVAFNFTNESQLNQAQDAEVSIDTTKVDFNNLFDIVDSIGQKDTAYCFSLLDSFYQLAATQNDYLAIAKIHNQRAVLNFKLLNINRAEIEIAKAISYAPLLGDNKILVEFYNNSGVIAVQSGTLIAAEEDYKKAIQLADKIQYPEGIIRSVKNLIHLYRIKDDPDEALNILSKYQRVFISEPTQKGRYFESIGEIFNTQENLDSAQYYYKKALTNYILNKNDFQIASIYAKMSFTEIIQGNYETAMEYLEQSDSFAIVSQNENVKLINTKYYGDLFIRIGDYPQAIEKLDLGISLSKQRGAQKHTVSLLSAKEIALRGNKSYESAIAMNQELISLCAAIGDSVSLVEQYNNLSMNFAELGILDSALYFANIFVKKKKEMGASDLDRAYQTIMVLLIKLEDFENAEINGKMALSYAIHIKDAVRCIGLLESLIEINLKLDDFKDAYLYSNDLLNYKNDLNNDKNLEIANNLKIQYQTSKKEDSIKLLKISEHQQKLINKSRLDELTLANYHRRILIDSIKIGDLKLDSMNNALFKEEIINMESADKIEKMTMQVNYQATVNKYLILLGSASLILIIFIFYYFSYKRKQIYRFNKLELENLLSFMQINPHAISNSFKAITAVYAGDATLGEKFANQLQVLYRKQFELAHTEDHTLTEELAIIKSYLDTTLLTYNQKVSHNIKILNKFDTDDVLVPSLILLPIVENAVTHHTPNSTLECIVDITLLLKRDTILCNVVDNNDMIIPPNYFEVETKKKRPSGLSITKKRIEILCKLSKKKGYLNFRKTNNLNEVTIEFPIKRIL
ncbi:MAG TPA: histidine kinase [Chitinophagales bacterium]|nr:histidine kinase [Chitinophagales bacterium]